MKAPEIGEISQAVYEGYRIEVHARFFPFPGTDEHCQPDGTTVHAVVDKGARAIFCSQEWFDSLPKVEA
jgi:hypothetical protein